jgi:hypothetical protein
LLLAALCGCRSRERSQPKGDEPHRVQWIEIAKITPGPIQHEQLTTEQVERISKVQEVFRQVDSAPLSAWLNDFKREVDPDRELRIYEGMAEAFTAYCSGRSLTLEAKRDAYGILLLRSGAPDAEVLKRVRLNVLTIKDAKEILALYKMRPAPIVVIPGSDMPSERPANPALPRTGSAPR